jgi:signal transduction histidine kinase
MSLYPLIPLFSCLVCTALGAALALRHGGQRAPRLAAALVGSAAVWALCEVLWNVQTDAGPALALVRLSALGWVWVAPLALHLFVELAGSAAGVGPRLLPYAYGGSVLTLAVTWGTSWFHTGVSRTSWGWAYHFGPAYPFFYLFTVGCVGTGAYLGWRAVRQTSSPGERQQARWVIAGVLIPLVVASLTDGLLPLAGVQVPRLGTASFAVLGAMVLWSFHRYGYSLLAPGDFASEILEALPDGVAMVRLDGSIRSANGALARLLEAEPAQLPGLHLAARFRSEQEEQDAGAGRRCELLTLRDRSRPVAVSSRPLRDRQGLAIGLVWVVRDLAEVEALRDRLLLSGRLAAVGQLAAGIAHEIANPLAYVRANLGLLRQHWGSLGGALEKAGARDDEAQLLGEGEEILDETLEGVDRATSIVRDVRGLAHGGRRERRPADLVELIEGVLRLAAPQLRERAQVERELRPVPLVWGAPQELQQVFLNLVLNAAQAVEPGGSIRVVTRSVERDVIVQVEDDGAGIDPEIRDRIFDPFFTTKSVGEGSGLGLGIAYGIVRSHGGEISVESERGRGTCFSVHLPAAADTIEET